EVRHRPAPQALPPQRPRRYRPHHGEERQDRALRAEGEGRARLGVRRLSCWRLIWRELRPQPKIRALRLLCLEAARLDRLRDRDRAARHLGMQALDHAAVDLDHALALALRQVEGRDHLLRLRDLLHAWREGCIAGPDLVEMEESLAAE